MNKVSTSSKKEATSQYLQVDSPASWSVNLTNFQLIMCRTAHLSVSQSISHGPYYW